MLVTVTAGVALVVEDGAAEGNGSGGDRAVTAMERLGGGATMPLEAVFSGSDLSLTDFKYITMPSTPTRRRTPAPAAAAMIGVFDVGSDGLEVPFVFCHPPLV